MILRWLGRQVEKWAVRQEARAVDRHLGHLFDHHNAKLCRIFLGMGAEVTIEFANVRLIYSNFRGEFLAQVSPILPVSDDHDVAAVLHALSGGKGPRAAIETVEELGARLRPWTHALVERFSADAYPAFRIAMQQYYVEHRRQSS